MATDRFTIRTVVVALAAVVVGGVACMGYLSMTQTPIPDQFDRLVTYLAGVLSGVLASTHSKSDEDPPDKVEVVNEPDNAVPVDPA